MKRLHRFSSAAVPLAALLSIALILFACTGVEQTPSVRVVIISLDGMADWLLDDLLAGGHMPNIARVLEHGVAAEAAYTTFPAKTAVGHASIWTGTNPSYNGIHGNSIVVAPYSEHSLIDLQSGYSAAGLHAEPVWSAVARQGMRAVVVQATQNAPFEYFVGKEARFSADPDNLLLFDGYDGRLLNGEAITEDMVTLTPTTEWADLPAHEGSPVAFELAVGETLLNVLFFDDPQDPATGFDTAWICTGADSGSAQARLKPAPANPSDASGFSDAVAVTVKDTQAAAYFRLFALAPDGSEFILYRTFVDRMQCNDSGALRLMAEQGIGFVGNEGYGSYSAGKFGPTVVDGGDGEAERCYLETIRQSTEQFGRAMAYALRHEPFDVMVGYVPYPDGPNHMWLGFAAEPTGSRDTEQGSAVWPYLLQAYTIVDDYVGTVLDNMPDDAVLMIVSDHGFTGTDRWFHPNVILRDAGLLALDDKGNVDLSGTQALFMRDNGFFFVNSTRFKDGIVPENEAPAVVDRIAELMLSARDGEGNPVVAHVIRPGGEGDELNMTGPYAGDLYIDLAPGYYATGHWDAESAVEQMPYPRGNHYGNPLHRAMQSIFIVGAKSGTIDIELGLTPSVDIAPTICRILGLKPPEGATGAPMETLVEAIRTQAAEGK